MLNFLNHTNLKSVIKKFLLFFSLFFLILIFAFLLYFPYIDVREFQGEEGRRVLIALQMLENKEFLIPQYFGKLYFNKPPLFNWILAFIFYLTKNCSELIARSVSTLMSCLTAFFISYIWKKLLDISQIKTSFIILLIPGLIFLTIPEVIDKAIRAEIDQTYTFLINTAVFSWFYLYEIKNKKISGFIISGIFLGLAILTKTFQALTFFYITIIPYFLLQKRFRELFTFYHLAGIFTYLFIFSCWAIPVNLKVGLEPFLKAWISQYKTAATNLEVPLIHHIKSYTLGFILGYSPWIFFIIFYFDKDIKNFINTYVIFKKLFLFSFYLFSFSYLFYFIFVGSRLRYILPSVGGFVFLSSLPILYYFITPQNFWNKYFSKILYYGLTGFLLLGNLTLIIYLITSNPLHNISYFLILNIFLVFILSIILVIFFKNKPPFNFFFISLVFTVFFIKQIYVSFYYPYHVNYLSPFKKSALEIKDILIKEKNNALFLCESIPHHLIYYLKYRFKVINQIYYLENCEILPSNSWILLPKNSKKIFENSKMDKIYLLKIKQKPYFLLKTN